MIYEWKDGARFIADAQKVGEELNRIDYKDAETVLKVASRKAKSELHKCFQWDDSVAGHKYRLDQARLILRMVVVTEESADENAEPIIYRAFEAVTLPGDESQRAMVYMPTKQALSDPELRVQIMARLERTIHEAERTAEQYATLVPSLLITTEKLREARESINA